MVVVLVASSAFARMQPPEPGPLPMLKLDASKLPIVEATIDGLPDGLTSDTAIFVANMQPGVPATSVRSTLDGPPLAIALVAPDGMVQALARDLVEKRGLYNQVPAKSQLITIGYAGTATSASAAVDEAIAELGKAPEGYAKRLLFLGDVIDPSFKARRAGIASFTADNSQRPGYSVVEGEEKVMQHWSATFDVTPLMAMKGGEVELVVFSKTLETEHVTVRFPEVAKTQVPPTSTTRTAPPATRSYRQWWLSGVGALVLIVVIVVLRRRR